MEDKCTQAAELLGLHKKARQTRQREYITGNNRLVSLNLTVKQKQKLMQAEQPRVLACAA